MSLDRSNVIDAMGVDEASGRVILILRHDAAWDGSNTQLFLLQEKFNTYLSFALDGEMAGSYPEYAERALGLRIETGFRPDPVTARFLEQVRQQVGFQDITLDVRVHPAHDPAHDPAHGAGSGHRCGCGGSHRH